MNVIDTKIEIIPLTPLEALMATSPEIPAVEALVEGPVIDIKKSSVYVDLTPFGTGIIYGREFINAKDIIKKINIGDIVKAKIVDRENEDGYIELSLKEAKQALMWSEAEDPVRDKMIFDLPIKEANKGGLILEWKGIAGFLPASQLKAEHYPRVTDGDKDKILKELKKLIGEKISVIIIGAIPKEGKLIFSEKDSNPAERQAVVGKYNVGDELECLVSGIVDFGIFLKIEEGLEGLVHISEIDWGLVEDPKAMFKVGDKVRAKIIEVKEGDIVKGVVIKYNKHGALVSIKEGVAGLVHNSTLGGEIKLREKLELGKTYSFQVTLFEPKDQRMTLTYLDEKK